MKFPSALEHILHGKAKTQAETFLSLILDPTYIMVAAWRVGPKGIPHVLHQVGKAVVEDTWELRAQAVDSAIVDLENILGTEELSKVVLGVSDEYLSGDGEIESSVRPHIKKLMSTLSLTALGFVPIHQAIIYSFKQDEGVPPNAILIGASGKTLSIYLYKIGALVGSAKITSVDTIAKDVETALKGIPNIEVLPSRMLLYGGVTETLEEVKRQLLHHPWQTRVNFLHFPKVEILPLDLPLTAVSIAGASELSKDIEDSDEDELHAHTTFGQPSKTVNDTFRAAQGVTSDTNVDVLTNEQTLGEVLAHEGVIPDVTQAEVVEPTEELMGTEEGKMSDEDANVMPVAPETLGFRAKEIAIQEDARAPREDYEMKKPEEQSENKRQDTNIEEEEAVDDSGGKFRMPKFMFPSFFLRGPKFGIMIGAVVLLLVLGGGYLMATSVLPRVKVTIATLPKVIEVSNKITINPKVTMADAETLTIPGHKLEKTLTGQKTIAVTGKKKIGDPAKGTVMVYNKSLTTKSLKKGAVISSGSLKFTLDTDVQVASASESIGSITFGKGSSTVTAQQIGSQGNLPANTEFAFADAATSIMIARNDTAFSGGTSKDVTVVSRADYDGLVKAVSAELTQQAKKDIAESVAGGEELIQDTVVVSVESKDFDQEIDEQVSELHGNVTVGVAGISYSKEDIKKIFEEKSKENVPSGYALVDASSDVSVSDVTVKKDGLIQADVKFTTTASPSVDEEEIRKAIVGKKVTEASEYLKNISGVGSVSYLFTWSLTKDKIPSNSGNISISIETQ